MGRYRFPTRDLTHTVIHRGCQSQPTAAAGSASSPRRRTAARAIQAHAPAPRDVDVGKSHVEGSTQGDALNERLRPGRAPTQGRALRRGSHRARTRRACAARGTPPDARRGSDGPRCLDEVAAVDLGRNLQPLALEAHTVVPIDRALVVLAHDVGQSGADEGYEGRAGFGRRHRELLVERRPVVLGQIAVRVLHRVDAPGRRAPWAAAPGESRTSAHTDHALPASRRVSSPRRAGASHARTASDAPGPPCPRPQA